MMIMGFIFSLVLVASPVRLAAPGLNGVGISKEQTAALGEHLATSFRQLEVITQRDITALLGFERQKQLLGCSDESTSCMAELGNALGVEGLLVGEVTRLGALTQVTLRVLAAVDGKRLALFSARVDREEELFSTLERAARQLEEDTLVALGRGALPSRGAGVSRAWAILPGAIAVGGLGAGVGLQLAAGADYAALVARTPPASGVTSLDLKEQGQGKQRWAAVAFGVGAAAAVATALVLILGGPSAAAPLSIAPGVDGSVVVSGVWP
jgi:hypothetical protein